MVGGKSVGDPLSVLVRRHNEHFKHLLTGRSKILVNRFNYSLDVDTNISSSILEILCISCGRNFEFKQPSRLKVGSNERQLIHKNHAQNPWFCGPAFLRLSEKHWLECRQNISTQRELCLVHRNQQVQPVTTRDCLRFSLYRQSTPQTKWLNFPDMDVVTA